MAIPSVHVICPTLVQCPIERARLVHQAELIATGEVEIDRCWTETVDF